MNLSERKIYKPSWMLLPFAFQRFTLKSPCLHFYKPPPPYLPHIMLSAKRAHRHSLSFVTRKRRWNTILKDTQTRQSASIQLPNRARSRAEKQRMMGVFFWYVLLCVPKRPLLSCSFSARTCIAFLTFLLRAWWDQYNNHFPSQVTNITVGFSFLFVF